jgi:hypothetical protein
MSRESDIEKAASVYIYRPEYTWAKRARYMRETVQALQRHLSGSNLSESELAERDYIWKMHCFAEDVRTESQRLKSNAQLTVADANWPDFETYIAPELPVFWARSPVFYDSVTTTNATPTVVRSVPVQINSSVFIDSICTWGLTSDPRQGGYLWLTLSFGRGSTGAPIARGTLDTLDSHNLNGMKADFVPNSDGTVAVTVTGKVATSIGWTIETITRKGKP